MALSNGAAGILAAGNLFGNVLGAISANASNSKQYKYQSRLQEQAARLNYEYGLKQAENMPSYYRKGYETAGFNPMLVVQNGTSGANSNFTTTGQMSAPDYAGSMASSASAIQNIQHLINETNQTESNVSFQKAQGRKAVAEAIGQEIRNPYISRREEAELGEIGAQTDKLIRETSFMDQLADYKEAELRLQEMGINLDYRARIYGADKGFAGTVYNADTNAETQRGIRTDRLPFGFGSTYYDMRGLDSRMRANDPNDIKYWRNYY